MSFAIRRPISTPQPHILFRPLRSFRFSAPPPPPQAAILFFLFLYKLIPFPPQTASVSDYSRASLVFISPRMLSRASIIGPMIDAGRLKVNGFLSLSLSPVLRLFFFSSSDSSAGSLVKMMAS